MVNIEDRQRIDMHVKLLSLSYGDDPDALMLLAKKFEQAAIENGWLRREYNVSLPEPTHLVRKHPRLVNAPRWKDTQ